MPIVFRVYLVLDSTVTSWEKYLTCGSYIMLKPVRAFEYIQTNSCLLFLYVCLFALISNMVILKTFNFVNVSKYSRKFK